MAGDFLNTLIEAKTTKKLEDGFFKRYGYENITEKELIRILDYKAKIAKVVQKIMYDSSL